MLMTIVNNIKSMIPRTESAKECMEFVKGLNQSFAKTLIGTLTTCKFDGTPTMHQHVIETLDTATKLRSMRMEVGESFVQFIINSLLSEYGPFQTNNLLHY